MKIKVNEIDISAALNHINSIQNSIYTNNTKTELSLKKSFRHAINLVSRSRRASVAITGLFALSLGYAILTNINKTAGPQSKSAHVKYNALSKKNSMISDVQLEREIKGDEFDQFIAGLVYIGGLKYATTHSEMVIEDAINKLVDNFNLVTTEKFSREDYHRAFIRTPYLKPTSFGVLILKKFSIDSMLPIRLESDLVSANPSQVRLAQNYMAFLGYDVVASGILDKATTTVANKLIQRPLQIPSDLAASTSRLHAKAIFGHVFLPDASLETDAYLTAKSLPLSFESSPYDYPREKFIASQLISGDLKQYRKIINDENERRSRVSLSPNIQSAALDHNLNLSYTPLSLTLQIQGDVLEIDSISQPERMRLVNLQPGDFIRFVGGMDVQYMTFNEITNHIDKLKGQPLPIIIERPTTGKLIALQISNLSVNVNYEEEKHSSERTVKVEATPDKKFDYSVSVGWGDETNLRGKKLIKGFRKIDRTITSDFIQILFKDNAPLSKRSQRLVHRLYNYGYCGTTDYYEQIEEQQLAHGFNKCLRSYRSHFAVAADSDLNPGLSKWLFKWSSPQDYLLFSLRDGKPNSDDIIRLQQSLNRLKFEVRDKTGTFGPSTANQLIGYMKSQSHIFYDVSQSYIRLLLKFANTKNIDFVIKLQNRRSRALDPFTQDLSNTLK